MSFDMLSFVSYLVIYVDIFSLFFHSVIIIVCMTSEEDCVSEI